MTIYPSVLNHGRSQSKTSFLMDDILSSKDQTQLKAAQVVTHSPEITSFTQRFSHSTDNDVSPQMDFSGNCSDDSSASKKKNRTAFTPGQICELENRFRLQQYLSTTERGEFASRLKLTDTQVKTWFQNRRMKLKRQQTDAENMQMQMAFLYDVCTVHPTSLVHQLTSSPLMYQHTHQPLPLRSQSDRLYPPHPFSKLALFNPAHTSSTPS